VEGTVELPEDMVGELTRLLTAPTLATRLGRPPAAGVGEMQAASRERVRAWKSFENGGGASPAERRVARTVSRSYEIMADRLSALEPAVA
jgi:hypothetical protein